MRLISEKLSNFDQAGFEKDLHNDRINANGNKLRTYRIYKTSVKTEQYILSLLPRNVTRTMALFRSGSLPLAVETERYSRPQIPLNERLMSDVIDSVNYHPESIPDHSILLCDLKCVVKQNSENYDCKVSKRIKRNTKNVPNDFLTDESVQQMVRDTITKIENFIHVDQDIQSAYNEFQELVQREMSNRLLVVKQIQSKRSKSFYKPYWNETLQNQ
ncbi:unnamed protein product [Mytilus coruscus]|uniref:Uncharacterized protein n=1 Tax=Mytilus coruscus TaxID=42192 RepID=A0A6J8CDH2_MYTCO|nr:unnamed protein product [Mytilus coruscus]